MLNKKLSGLIPLAIIGGLFFSSCVDQPLQDPTPSMSFEEVHDLKTAVEFGKTLTVETPELSTKFENLKEFLADFIDNTVEPPSAVKSDFHSLLIKANIASKRGENEEVINVISELNTLIEERVLPFPYPKVDIERKLAWTSSAPLKIQISAWGEIENDKSLVFNIVSGQVDPELLYVIAGFSIDDMFDRQCSKNLDETTVNNIKSQYQVAKTAMDELDSLPVLTFAEIWGNYIFTLSENCA